MDQAEDRDILTVSDLTFQIKEELEGTYKGVWVEGEISNYRGPASSGHIYFGMRDEKAALPLVMWRGAAAKLIFEPEDGMKVLAFGNINVYPPHGKYQFDVKRMEPQGVGSLQIAFEKLKRKLQDEGLFDEARKKTIPAYPKAVGVITSPTGAVIRDILNVSADRCPWVDIYILPVNVQGTGAAAQIAGAIDWVNANAAQRLDTLIVARGGGSLEDLWAFNEEPVARAIAASQLPVISAVGHEVDFTIADFAADLRAPTPSAAAMEMSVGADELRQRLKGGLLSLEAVMSHYLRDKSDQLENRSYRLQRLSPEGVLLQHVQRVDELRDRFERALKNLMENQKQRLGALAGKLDALSPLAILGRGYAAAFSLPAKTLIKSYKNIKIGDEVEVRLGEGGLRARVEETHE